MYYIVEIKDDAYATHTIITIAPTLEMSKQIVLNDYFEGDKEYMSESEISERKYLENCKGCFIATESDLRELVEDGNLDISDLEQYTDYLSETDWFTDYRDNGF